MLAPTEAPAAAAWTSHDGEPPVLEDTLIRLQVNHFPVTSLTQAISFQRVRPVSQAHQQITPRGGKLSTVARNSADPG